MKGSMKKQFEGGQLVRYKSTHGPGGHGAGSIGRVVAVDRDYYGAKQAFKVYGAQRGQAIGPWSANGIGPTKDGIRDRVTVVWYTGPHVDGLQRRYDGKKLEILEGQSEQS